MKPCLSAAQSILAICLLASFSCIPRQPAAKDADRDGLVDAHEAIFGTDPAAFDTDGDGVGDALELLYYTDPGAAASRPLAFVDDAAPCLLYAASHDASGFWTLSALGCGFETFALLGRPNGGGPFGVAFDPPASCTSRAAATWRAPILSAARSIAWSSFATRPARRSSYSRSRGALKT